MTLSILGLGLVSPAGSSARENVFFLRAEAPPPWPSPFVLAGERTMPVGYCPWVASLGQASKRMLSLGAAAIEDAIQPIAPILSSDRNLHKLPLFVVMPAQRAGLAEAELAAIATELGKKGRAAVVQRFVGAAGAFVALDRARQVLASNEAPAVLIVAVDSLLGLDDLVARAKQPPSPWTLAPPPPSEGAGAILVTTPEQAGRWNLPAVADLVDAKHGPGRANDDNDDASDAMTLTLLLEALASSARAPIASAFGQPRTDQLRQRDWEWTVARCAARFHPQYFAPSLESDVGSVGAAAGLMALAYGVAAIRHGTAPGDSTAPAPFVSWAISRDGTRGITIGSTPLGSTQSVLALRDAARARSIDRDRFDVSPDDGAMAETALPDDPDIDAIDDEYEPTAAETAELDALDAANDVAPRLRALPATAEKAAPVRLDAERAASFDVAGMRREVVAHCCETAAMLLRERIIAPMRGVAETERRILAQLDAIFVAGKRALHDVVDWWVERAEDPYKTLAGALATLSFDGEDAGNALAHVVKGLPEDAADLAIAIGEAMNLIDRTDLLALARKLHEADHPILRAAGLDVQSARGQLLPDAIHKGLADPSPIVVRSAIWASEPLPATLRTSFAAKLLQRIQSDDELLVWPAARVLAVWNDRTITGEIASGSMDTIFGPRAIELYILHGKPTDLKRIEAILSRFPMTADILDGLARFGHVAVAPRLVGHLDDTRLADAAADALSTLFGAIVQRGAELDAGAWRDAIGARAIDPKIRLRRGHPWSASIVADEGESGILNRAGTGKRIDELRARCTIPDGPPLTPWWPTTQATMSRFFTEARRRGSAQ